MSKSNVKGTCQACLQKYTVDEANAVSRHGYKRPGYGYEIGRCSGSGELPLELDKSVCEQFLANLRVWRKNTAAAKKAFEQATELHVVRSTTAYDKAVGRYSRYGHVRDIVEVSLDAPTAFDGRDLPEAIALGAVYEHGRIAGDREWQAPKEERDRRDLRSGEVYKLTNEIDGLDAAIKEREGVLNGWEPKPLAKREDKRVRPEKSERDGAWRLFTERDQPIKRKRPGSWRSAEPVVFGTEEAARKWAATEGLVVVESF